MPHRLPSAAYAFIAAVTLAFLAMSPINSDSQSTTLPVPQTGTGILARQSQVVARARESIPTDVIFIGDSITQGWEDTGANIWKDRFAPLHALNLGVSGDRTEHVLWRLDQAPLTRLAPKVIVLLIGTNNLGHGTADGPQTLAGIRAVVTKVRQQVPTARILLCAIFPRDREMSAMRGELVQINQALTSAYAHDTAVRVIDLGSLFVAADGSISQQNMPDYLHLSPAGYQIWADGIRAPLADALKPN